MPSLVAERSVLKTAPAAEPFTTAEAKLHLRVTGSADDTYIDNLVKAARRKTEQYTGRALINQTWYLYADAFPDGDRFRLPKAPLSSVTSITYVDSAGATTVYSGDYWDADANAVPGELVLVYGQQWPSATLRAQSPIVIEYVAGYGAAGSNIPEDIRQAMLLLISHMYEMREPVIAGTIVTPVPMAWEWMLGNYVVEYFG